MKGYKKVKIKLIKPLETLMSEYAGKYETFPYIYIAEDMSNYMAKFDMRLAHVYSTVTVDCPRGFTMHYIVDKDDIFRKVKKTKLSTKMLGNKVFAEKDGFLYIVREDLRLL